MIKANMQGENIAPFHETQVISLHICDEILQLLHKQYQKVHHYRNKEHLLWQNIFTSKGECSVS